MKILVINNLYPPDALGGYERSIADYARLLQHRGHDVRVLTSGDSQQFSASHISKYADPVVERCLSLGGTYSLNQGAEWLPPDVLGAVDNRNRQILAQHLQAFQPDVCLVGNLDLLNVDLVEQVLAAQVPVAHYVMNKHPGYVAEVAPKSPLYRYLTCSNWVTESLRQAGYPADTALTVYPGAAVDEFYQAELPPHDRLRIAYASLVMHYKGADVLLEALWLLKAAGVEFTATIAGGTLIPSYADALKEHVESEGLQDCITFPGVLSRPELIQLYKTHNVLAFPSRFEEPFGISQVEAMAAGLTLITSGTGGAGEIVEHGQDGLLFESENPLDLADALSFLPANPAEWDRLTRSGQQKALTQFSQASSLETLERALVALAETSPNASTQSVHSR
ncbi:glycosyltransferase family 4 protein [Leptolyngbya sp. FACHB-36]|uniref:glycosyltransferase family 4 protein n=1 Tax=Leptolyngbya sp. FACHB-36 TaxID=2692808 RepID=UPI00168116DB|nr:glycosyltransferase family 4 protein [Leptolyngbya sp. FACHB-36]MBD2020192.1 glycosyltransferase family 4 protein [Leptolyngbya sp. FACHB-36]